MEEELEKGTKSIRRAKESGIDASRYRQKWGQESTYVKQEREVGWRKHTVSKRNTER